MLTLLEMEPQSSIYLEARKRGLPDLITGSLIREFERENWREPSSFKELLEVLE